MKLFLAHSQDLGARFAFNAKNEVDALTKINAWNDYHSLTSINSRAIVNEISPDDLPFYKVAVHNEYVK
jgi:hypothetical protein